MDENGGTYKTEVKMKRIKVSPDTALTIIQNMLNDKDINYTITDESAPEDWQGKKVQEILNVHYYAYKHRPIDTEKLIFDLMKTPYNSLESLTRAFCILSLSNTERVFSRNVDVLSTTANLEYWIQTDKIKLLEEMFEDLDIEVNGIRIPIQIDTEDRQMLVMVGDLNVTDISEITEFGEMSVCELSIGLIFYPNAASLSDYIVSINLPNEQEPVELPINRISFSTSMTQKSVPLINTPEEVGNINLSRVKSIVLAFDGYNNKAIDYITRKTLINGQNTPLVNSDNNELISVNVKRGEYTYTYSCVIKDHTIIVEEGSGNESHSLTLDIRGIA